MHGINNIRVRISISLILLRIRCYHINNNASIITLIIIIIIYIVTSIIIRTCCHINNNNTHVVTSIIIIHIVTSIIIRILMKDLTYHFRCVIATLFPNDYVMRINNIHFDNNFLSTQKADTFCVERKLLNSLRRRMPSERAKQVAITHQK